MKQKNVLLVVTDDQRYDTLHALGNKDIHTPNMDWLAKQGTVFTQAHIPGATSGAMCMPSRAMIHSGRTLFHLEKEGQRIPSEHTTLGEVFQQSGYECFGTGKWHNGPSSYARSFNAGGTIFFGGMWDHWNVPTSAYDPTGEYDNEINFIADFSYGNKKHRVHCDEFQPGVHSSQLLTDTAVNFLEKREKKAPFFLYLAYLAPHDPRTMPKEYESMYLPEDITLPPNCWAEHPFPIGVEDIRDEALAKSPREEQEIRRHLAEYYGMISHLDAELGRVLQALKDTGELENTIIVFTSDNGLAVGSHALMGKQNHYDHSVRIPLIVCDPSLEGGIENHNYVYLMDIFPTLCDMADLPIPDSVEGKSFALAVENPEISVRDSLYFAYNDLLRSVKKDGFKLIEYRNKSTKTQLFSLVDDPYEINNLAESPEYEEVLAQLKARLLDYKETWEDTSHPYTQNFWESY